MTRRLALPALALAPLLFFALGPVLLLLARSVGALGAAGLSELWTAGNRLATLHTVLVSTGAASFALCLATPLALLLARTDVPSRRVLLALFTLPTAVPPFIWGMGWVSLASPRAGYLARWWGEGAVDIYGAGGIVFVLGAAGLPLVLLPGVAALSRIDPALEEAARIAGAGPLSTLLHVSYPLALPSLLSGAALVFLFAASAFGVPHLLGIGASPPMEVLTTRIFGQLLLGGPEHFARAVALSSVLLVLATAVGALGERLARAGRVRVPAGKGLAVRRLPLGRWRWPLGGALWIIALVLILLPLAAVFFTSLQTRFGAPLELSSLTARHWTAALHDDGTWRALGRSVALAAGAALVIVGLGLLLALVRRAQPRFGGWVESLAAWPYAVPGTVLAMSLLVAFSRDLRFVAFDRVAFVLALANSLWLVGVAYAAKHLVFGVRNASDGLRQLDPALTEAARLSGAGPARAFVDVTLPLLQPALAAAFVLAFLTCTTELTMSVLLLPPGVDLLGTLLFELQTYADPNRAAVLACFFVVWVVVLLALLAMLRRGAK